MLVCNSIAIHNFVLL